MGVVYRARDPLLNREVAVKLVSSGDLTPEMEERFQREAQVVAQMDHPAIVPIYDIGRHDGSLFFVMPVASGTNLLRLIRDQSLRLGEVVDIGIQVADALDYSHSRGVIHRDIKPANIMVTREEGGGARVRVMDFGLAHATTESRLTKTGTLVGTVAYLSPEQVASRAFDGRSDVYSLGVVLYECLVGEPPFTGEVQSILYRIVHEIPQPPRNLGAEIREELQDVVLRCLEKDAARRPQKAGQVADALRRHKASLATDEFRMSVVLSASRAIQRPSLSVFIGREKEFAELQRRLNAAIAGDCQFAVVAGEPGIGKTRLLEELKNLALARKIRVLYGRFVEQDRSFSYQGFCELVQDYFRSRDSSNSGERPDFSDLAADLIALFPQLSEIGELRSAVSGDSRIAVPAAERKVEDRIQIFELLARTLTRIAGGNPLVLILENLHGAEISIEALQYIVRRLGPTPTLIVGSYRQTETDKRHPLTRMLDSFVDDPRFVSLTLPPFSPSEHRSFVESIVGAPKVSDDLAQRLRDATEGNPFFTKELIRSLVESGGIARDDTGGWSFSREAEISADALPATIQQAVEKRIERLPEELRELLSIASVLGKTFDSRDLETLAEDAKGIEDSIDRLILEGIFEEDRESRGDRLTFSSGIVRDVLYGALSRRRRRSLHRKYAELIEKRSAGRLERVYPELVHHYWQGDVPEKTVEYGLKLAQKSIDTFNPEDAIRVAKIALEFLEDDEWSGDAGLEGEARFMHAQGQRMTGNVEGALREAEAAVRVFDASKSPARAVAATQFAADTAWQARRIEDARRWVERGIEAARATREADPLIKLLSLGATVANLRGEHARATAYQAEIEELRPREKAANQEIPRGGALVVAMANPIAAVEPAVYDTTEEHEVLANAFETLVTTDAQGNLAGCLCERWATEDAGGALRLHLRRGVLFSDGSPLTGTAVKAALERSIRLSREVLPSAFTAIVGVTEHVDGRAAGVSGIEVVSDDELRIRLTHPVPILPSLLTDGRTSVAAAGPAPEAPPVGTGPFRIVTHTPEAATLERNPRYWKSPPAIDRIEFRASLSPSQIAEGIRSGSLDVARDLLPQDLEALLREPRLRGGLVETPKKNTYFAVFHTASPFGSNVALRTALAGLARTQDFVWGALGRFALPATGVIPPGILGHDPGRRQPHLSREKALEMIRDAGLSGPVRLRAVVHPILQNRYGALTQALLRLWAEVGVEVDVATTTMPAYLDAWNAHEGVDVLIGRWIADYDDPDNFTHAFFHSGSGRLRAYFSSPQTDRLLEEARTESRPPAREALYRKFEQGILEAGIIVPLFHDVDYRIAAPAVRGIQLHSTAPYVNYAELGKTAVAHGGAEAAEHAVGGGILHVPIQGLVRSLDPSLTSTVEQADVMPSIYETLTWAMEGTRIVPWLASEVRMENEGARFRIRLQPGVRFHDGRRLTARDVRHSWERLLLNAESESRWVLSVIQGADRLIEGKATDLAGFHIVSPTEFVVDLDKPIPFFPAMISYAATAVLPEGTETVGSSPRAGAIGTGAFRVVSFEPGRRVELERNPTYWRGDRPRSEGIVFHFGIPPEEIRDEFLAGRLSIARDLLPADAEAFRHDPRFASGYRESPRLTTYFVVCSTRRGPLRDVETRRGLARALNTSSLVRRTLGRLAIPAHGLIPPGLLGYAAVSSSASGRASGDSAPSDSSVEATISRETVDLVTAVHPIFFSEFATFFKELGEAFREIGYRLRPVNRTMAEYLKISEAGDADLEVGRWTADYPDSDTFLYGCVHSSSGAFRNYVSAPEIDRLAEQGRVETDPRVRHSLYRQAEELIARDALILPLFHDQVYCFARPEVHGLTTIGQSNATIPYEDLWIRR